MNIPHELLAEKNYTGTRKILVNDPKVRELKAQLKGLQQKINPHIEKLQPTLAKFDEANSKIAELDKEIKKLQEKIKEIHEEIAPDRKIYDKVMDEIKPFDDEAMLIKNKLEPLVIKIVEDQLTEFEKPLHVTEDEETGEIYVEVADEIEQYIIAKREQKAKAAAAKREDK